MINLQKVLVPTDFSGDGNKAAIYGAELAARFGAQLQLVHVVDPAPIMYGEGGGYVPGQTDADMTAVAERMLGEIDVGEDVNVQVARKVLHGHPFVEIVKYARENDVDLIVIGTHGRGAIAHMLLGSVAEKVVRKAPCPVLVVRDEEHDFVMP